MATRAGGHARLGFLLVERGAVTEAQLALALKEQQRTGRRIGEVLAALGFTTEDEISASLAAQAGVEFVELSTVDISSEARALLDVDFCRERVLIPFALDDESVRVAMSNTFDILTVDTIGQRTGRRVDVVTAAEHDILQALDRSSGTCARQNLEKLIKEALEASRPDRNVSVKRVVGQQPVVVLVDAILRDAVRAGSTDLHLEPEARLVRTRNRIDGVLVQGSTLPKELQAAVTARLKLIARLDISESRIPQDGKINADIDRRPVNIRVSTLPTIHGENVVMRILDKSKVVIGLEDLGYTDGNLRAFDAAIRRPAGIILVTGPTGSGKTTTLYAALSALNTMDLKIATLEDPVEYELPMIRQSQVNVQAGLTFGAGLRALLRQDPDVILVGEMRDAETVEVALRAAMTGHLVLSTLHTNSAAGAIPRLRDMNVEPFLLASTLVSVLAQRLVRQLCPDCKKPEEEPDAGERRTIGVELDAPAFAPVGCERCNNTGFRGRRAVAEVLSVSPRVAQAITDGKDPNRIAAVARSEGMVTMASEARRLVLDGTTSVHEAVRHTWDAELASAAGDAGEPRKAA